MLRYKIAPKYPLSGPFRHSGVGRNPGAVGPVRSYNLNFTYPYQPPSRGQALGTFLRSFRWGHVRQLDRVSRELLSRAWAAGAGPGDGPLTIDLDSTICETYGLTKEGHATTATPASGAITRCCPSPPEPARC